MKFFLPAASQYRKSMRFVMSQAMSTMAFERMPTIGVVGVTIPGAVDCIQKINQVSHGKFQVAHQHPNIKLDQRDFSVIHAAQNAGKWSIVADRLVMSIHSLTDTGADFAIIPANTVHRVIAEVQSRSSIPVLNMLDIVADECQAQGFKKAAVFGTRWTMADHLYKESFAKRGIVEVVPSAEDQSVIQQAIFSELIPTGAVSPETLAALLRIVAKMKATGCDAVALACTELPLVLNANNCGMAALDTNALLAKAAVNEVVRLLSVSNLIPSAITAHT